jgi:5-methylcytosine-specific restriction protein A
MLFSADVTRLLQELVRSSEAGRAGYVMFRPDVLLFDGTSQTEPFSTTSQPSSYERGEDNTTKTLLAEDVDLGGTMNSAVRKAIVMIRQRNQKAVKALKKLYGHRCQVTGVQFTFKKKDGQWYSEAHHLIPLGKGGADDPRNIIIVSPLIHRMLHYADVSTVSMSNLHENDDGSASLAIRINNTDYTVVWHSLHASKVLGR